MINKYQYIYRHKVCLILIDFKLDNGLTNEKFNSVSAFCFSYNCTLWFCIFNSGIRYSGEENFVDNKCAMCHPIISAEIISKKKESIDLSKLSGNLTADFLTKYLKKEAATNDKIDIAAFKGSDEDLNKMAEWFLTFKRKKLLNKFLFSYFLHYSLNAY